MDRIKVVIIGGGFGGLAAAKGLKKSDCDVTVIDKTNHHLFQPLLYQVATAALSPGDIAAPIRDILRRHKSTRVIMSEVLSIDRANRKVILSSRQIDFDYLIVAIGSRHSYFGNDGWEKYAPGLKTLADALNIREKILLSYEKAELADSKEERERYLTFVVIGGGPTGVEISGALAEIARKTMSQNFRNIDPLKARIVLVEAADRILQAYNSSLSEKAKKSLEDLGVEVMLNTKVTDVNRYGVKLGNQFIESSNVIWAAGNTIPPLIRSLNAETDRIGRAIVDSDCSLKDDENIFVIGDAAFLCDSDGKPLPGVCPVAVQQGEYVAKIIKRRIPKNLRKPFKYFDKGNLATIGRAKAVMEIGKLKASGFIAWLLWSFVHIFFLIGFRNRYKVMAEWIWYYITYRHGIRLITKSCPANN